MKLKCSNGRMALTIAVVVLWAVVLISLLGCTVNKSVELSLDSIGYLSDEVSDAGKRGWITDATEDELQDKLYSLTVVAQLPYEPGSAIECGDAQTKNECIDKVLREVEDKLREGDK